MNQITRSYFAFCTVDWPGKCLLSFTSLVSFLDQPLGSSPAPDWSVAWDLVSDWSGAGHVTGSVARQLAPAVLVRLVLAAGEITVFSNKKLFFWLLKILSTFQHNFFQKLSKVRAGMIFKSTLWTILEPAAAREQLTNPRPCLTLLIWMRESLKTK